MKTVRDMRLDALRGLFLLIMAGVHVPTPVSQVVREPVGFTSAAEGFIFLSASLAGMVYGRIYLQKGWAEMRGRVVKRTRLVYITHLAVLIPIALIAWCAAEAVVPLANHFHDFLLRPGASLALMPLLLHQPPLFDILPLYVIFLGATPGLLALALRTGWRPIVLLSASVWLAAQFLRSSTPPSDSASWLPFRWGPFNLAAWQFLWVSGLALGESALKRPLLQGRVRLTAAIGAGVIVGVGLLMRHGFAAIPPEWLRLLDKWSLGPLRVLNFSAWVLLLVAWNPVLPLRLLRPTALLGRHSLLVFSAHLPLVIVATTVIQLLALSPVVKSAIGLAVMGALFPVALWQERRTKDSTPNALSPASQQPVSLALKPVVPLAALKALCFPRRWPGLYGLLSRSRQRSGSLPVCQKPET